MFVVDKEYSSFLTYYACGAVRKATKHTYNICLFFLYTFQSVMKCVRICIKEINLIVYLAPDISCIVTSHIFHGIVVDLVFAVFLWFEVLETISVKTIEAITR